MLIKSKVYIKCERVFNQCSIPTGKEEVSSQGKRTFAKNINLSKNRVKVMP